MASRSETELLICFNPRPKEIEDFNRSRLRRVKKASKRDREDEHEGEVCAPIVVPSDSGSESDETDHEEGAAEVDELHTSKEAADIAAASSVPIADDEISVKGEDTPMLDVWQCRAVFSVRIFMGMVWPKIRESCAPCRTEAEQRAKSLLQESWHYFSSATGSWIKVRLVSCNASSMTVNVKRYNSPVLEMDLYDCWSQCLQPFRFTIDHSTFGGYNMCNRETADSFPIQSPEDSSSSVFGSSSNSSSSASSTLYTDSSSSCSRAPPAQQLFQQQEADNNRHFMWWDEAAFQQHLTERIARAAAKKAAKESALKEKIERKEKHRIEKKKEKKEKKKNK